MNYRYALLALLLGGYFHISTAQRFVPLMENEQLRTSTKERPIKKMACGTFDLVGIEQITVGESRSLRVDLDTVGLGSDLDSFLCDGCTEARFGTVELRSDTVIYTPNPEVQQGLDTFSLQVCSPGGVCSEPATLIVLVQRPGRTVELGNQVLAPQERTEVAVPDGDLPGGAVCRDIEACAADYGGREQRFGFVAGFEQRNDIAYSAARFAGTDTVCVTLCNALGLCDTYRSSFTIQRPAVDLPFFDDFSYASSTFRPDLVLWQDEDVFVNDNYAILPPSIGVATFDALDFDGRPYEASGNARAGLTRDLLTSAPINLGGRTGSVLSFYVQPKGLGNRPEVLDSFLVQFLDQAGVWQTVFSREGRPTTEGNNVINPFEGVLVPVPAEYLYDGFQFRFGNRSAERGAVDHWNLDYVKLDDRSTTLVNQDLALSERPFGLLEPYTSVPARHLRIAGEQLLRDSIFLTVSNLRPDITPLTNSMSRIDQRDQSGFFVRSQLVSGPLSNDNGVPPDTIISYGATFAQYEDFETLRRQLFENDIDLTANFRFTNAYNLTVASEDASFDPAISRNNLDTTVTLLADYFAYDDGSAEVAIEGQRGNVIVQRYEAFVPDQLTGIRIRLPRGLGNVADQTIRFNIYGEGIDSLPGDLLYSFDEPVLFAEEFFFDSLQAFTSYALPEPLDLPLGAFFVGWEQLSNDRSIPVGFDRNNQPTRVQFFDSGSGWQALSGATRGAIMIRPLMAGADIDPTSTEDPVTFEQFVQVFPNPTDGLVRIQALEPAEGTDLDYRLFDLNGAVIREGKGFGTLDLGPFPAGIYLLECRAGTQGRGGMGPALKLSRHLIVRR